MKPPFLVIKQPIHLIIIALLPSGTQTWLDGTSPILPSKPPRNQGIFQPPLRTPKAT